MTDPRAYSLRWRLVSRLVALQAAALTLFVLAIFAALWGTGYLVRLEPEDAAIGVLADAVQRSDARGLALRPTPALARLRERNPSLWFEIRDDQARVLTEGSVPPEYGRAGTALSEIGQARLGWNLGDPPRPTARMKRVESEVGPLQVLIGSAGPMPWSEVLWAVLVLFLSVILPALVLMTLVTLITTPIVVRRVLAGLDAAAGQAGRIGSNNRGSRLPLGNVPSEVVPLVRAVNDALQRLDDGYERRQRFLTDAAHELRTPIAILMTRLETLQDGPGKTRLIADAARLSSLAEQLLDLQRVDRHLTFRQVNLVALGQRVVADLAPLAIAEGYDLSFESEDASSFVVGDEPSLERALVNIVQNAVEHGGNSGSIVVRAGNGEVEVCDEGRGIPAADRRRIFEPFQRLRPRTRGAGLGLHLVSEIVRLHGGVIEVGDGPRGGVSFRIRLPSASEFALEATAKRA